MTENGGAFDPHRPEVPSSTGWATFEARVRGRRFARCIERAHEAIDSGALEAAREAVSEAQALMPDAPEITELESKIASQPSPTAVLVAAERPYLEPDPGWPRVIGAMAVLLVLFGLFGFGLAQLYFARPAQQLLTTGTAPLDDELTAVKKAVKDTPATAAVSPAPQTPIAMSPPASSRQVGVAKPAGTAGGPTPPAPPARRSIVESEPPERPVQKPRIVVPPASPGLGSAPRPATVTTAEPTANAPSATLRLPERTAAPESGSAPISALPAAPPPNPPAPEVPASSPPPVDTPVPASSASMTAGSRAAESARIRTVLTRYESAYNKLDATAASSVWPTVDEAALNRAFKGLLSQRVSLGLCDITIIGDIGGASCVGKARWEPRVGGGVQTADRHWTFNLRRSGDTWKIEQIRVR
jgi:hypothetical protein